MRGKMDEDQKGITQYAESAGDPCRNRTIYTQAHGRVYEVTTGQVKKRKGIEPDQQEKKKKKNRKKVPKVMTRREMKYGV